MLKKCVVCEAEFEARGIRVLTCRRECRRIYHNLQSGRRAMAKYVPVPPKPCVECGKSFKATGSKRTCSLECAAHRDLKLDRASKYRCYDPFRKSAERRRYMSLETRREAARQRDRIRGSNLTASYHILKEVSGDAVLSIAPDLDTRRRAAFYLVRELQSKGIEALL